MEQGAYLFQDVNDKDICLFMFKKLSREQMNIVLPINKTDKNEGEYFIAILKQGKDYLGKTLWNGIDKLMSEQPMYDLMNLSYIQIHNHITILTEEEYTKYKIYVNQKMSNFIQIQNNVS